MKLSPPQRTVEKNIINGYTIWLSENDTYNWAHKPSASWPCSQLVGHRICAIIDNNGLCDLYIDGIYSHDFDCEIDSIELEACIGDFLPKKYRKFWPCWKF